MKKYSTLVLVTLVSSMLLASGAFAESTSPAQAPKKIGKHKKPGHKPSAPKKESKSEPVSKEGDKGMGGQIIGK